MLQLGCGIDKAGVESVEKDDFKSDTSEYYRWIEEYHEM